MKSEPTIMLSKGQVKKLKEMGLYREPVIRPDNWIEDMMEKALNEEVERLRTKAKDKYGRKK